MTTELGHLKAVQLSAELAGFNCLELYCSTLGFFLLMVISRSPLKDTAFQIK